MISFYCSRCGAALEVDDAHPAGHPVRCASCRLVVRTPDVFVGDVPEARLAPPPLDELPAAVTGEIPAPDDDPPFAARFEAEPISYGIASYPPRRFRDEAALEELAERLERVEHDVTEDESGMIECKHCGSTIAGFIGICPFCRNALGGRA